MSDTIHAAPAPLVRNLHDADPAEIDGKLVAAEDRLTRLGLGIQSLERELAVAEHQAAGYGVTRKVRSVQEITSLLDAARNEMTAVAYQARQLDDEYTRRGGWSRYYLVEDGHLHYDVSDSRCSRIPTTRHYWMTEFSGTAPKLVIAKAGERVCTTCFPDAPVAPRPGHPRFMTPAEAHAAALREQAARDRAARKAAQITNPDGTELYVPGAVADAADDRTDLVKTERAASNRALQAAGDLAFYGTTHPSAPAWIATVDLCVAALAHRRGVGEQAVRDEVNAKVAKKARREAFQVLSTI